VQIRPDFARYTPSPDPAHGSALYQNAVAGMEHFLQHGGEDASVGDLNAGC